MIIWNPRPLYLGPRAWLLGAVRGSKRACYKIYWEKNEERVGDFSHTIRLPSHFTSVYNGDGINIDAFIGSRNNITDALADCELHHKKFSKR